MAKPGFSCAADSAASLVSVYTRIAFPAGEKKKEATKRQ